MRAVTLKLICGAALLSAALGLLPAGRTRAAVGDDKAAELAARLQALEQRLAETEQRLRQAEARLETKDLELARLREELDLLYGLEATTPPPASPTPAATPGASPAPAVRPKRAAPSPAPSARPTPEAREPGHDETEEPELFFWPEDPLGGLPGGEDGLVEARVVQPDGSRLGAAVGAPGLVLSDELAEQMGLTDEEQKKARGILAAARKKLAGELERSLRETGQLGETGRRIDELEAETEQDLADFLKPEQLQLLREARAQTRGLRQELRIELGGTEPPPEDVETVPGSGRTF